MEFPVFQFLSIAFCPFTRRLTQVISKALWIFVSATTPLQQIRNFLQEKSWFA